jgi:RNA polymerase sigma-70 factor (ECF subfamily)
MAAHSSGSSTRPSLLLRVRDPRDAEAWQTFVDVYGRLVYRHCRCRGLGHEDAENVTQEVFAQVSQSIRRFDYQPEVGCFRGWLGTMTRNEINRFLKKNARVVHGSGGGEDEHGLDSAAARGEDTAWAEEFNAHLLATALARSRPHFEDQTWRAFELVWLENRPALEVARELGVPIDRVYVAKSRVLERLQQEVRDLAEDSSLFGR